MKKRVPNLAQDTKSTKRPRTAAPPPLALGQLSLLRGTSRAQRAHFRLSRFRSRKKSYSGTGLVCVLCSHSHHSRSFCPSAPTEESKYRIPFVETLLKAPRVDTSDLASLDIEQARLHLERAGAELNEGNPWSSSSARKDRLRARLGYWKAIGCDSFTLSWLAYGKKLTFFEPPENLSFPNHPSTRGHTLHHRPSSAGSRGRFFL
jgi:hypothetical protein